MFVFDAKKVHLVYLILLFKDEAIIKFTIFLWCSTWSIWLVSIVWVDPKLSGVCGCESEVVFIWYRPPVFGHNEHELLIDRT